MTGRGWQMIGQHARWITRQLIDGGGGSGM
jgi:hypothetical protein